MNAVIAQSFRLAPTFGHFVGDCFLRGCKKKCAPVRSFRPRPLFRARSPLAAVVVSAAAMCAIANAQTRDPSQPHPRFEIDRDTFLVDETIPIVASHTR
jgi:hypothetical protein